MTNLNQSISQKWRVDGGIQGFRVESGGNGGIIQAEVLEIYRSVMLELGAHSEL